MNFIDTLKSVELVLSMDKILFIHKYGSKKAKKIAVDEKLKMM